MNLREAIEAYANAVSSWDHYEIVGNGKQNAESVARLAVCSQSLDVLLALAEASMALSEYIAFAPFDRPEAAEYFRERGRLWDIFMQAHKAAKEFEKAKKDRKFLAGEGET